MVDIVERCRRKELAYAWTTMHDAADEIERLRAEIAQRDWLEANYKALRARLIDDVHVEIPNGEGILYGRLNTRD